MKKILNFALRENRPCIIYYQGKDEITRRKILISKIYEDKIYAYCYLREKNRYFKIENILSCVLEERG